MREETIRKKEQEINARFPEAYRKFLSETAFNTYQTFDFETPYDAAIFYPKAMAEVGEFHSTFGAFYLPPETGGKGSWTEPEDGEIGRLKILLYGGESILPMAEFNNGNWTMPCVQIGTLNEDLLIILDCETGNIDCIPHDEVWFEFDSREDYEQEMRVTAQDVFFPDFESFFAWCGGNSVYTPKSFGER